MQQKKNWLRFSIAGASAIGVLMTVGAASAATRGMVGALGIQNPSTTQPFAFEAGPGVFGRKIGAYPPTAGFQTVQVAGATGGTFVGRQITLMANQMNFQGGRFRDFPAFPNVGQTIKTFMSVQNAATFMNGGGALANCPGAGCTSNGAGTAISFCPPLAHNPANAAPGTVGNKVGNWDCLVYNNPGAGNRNKRFAINNAPGANHFGGTLLVLRNTAQNVWRVPQAPSTPMAPNAQVERSWMSLMDRAWTGGRPNFEFASNPGNNGPRLLARLNANGAVQSTFGCANGAGTIGVGKTFMGIPAPGGPFPVIIGPGNNCGTDPGVDNPGQGWGFKMTTGTISGSDVFPFSDETTALGTPFNPQRVPLVGGQGFFFTRMGDDSVVGTARNIVLIGGAISVDPDSGNAFDRVTHLSMKLQVPEPASALGLIVGAGALVGLARRRSANQR
jgi:hypothetical protein